MVKLIKNSAILLCMIGCFSLSATTDNAHDEMAAQDSDQVNLDQGAHDEAFLSTITGWIKKGIEKLTGLFGKAKTGTDIPNNKLCPGIVEAYPTKDVLLDKFPSLESMCGARDDKGTCKSRRDWQVEQALECYK